MCRTSDRSTWVTLRSAAAYRPRQGRRLRRSGIWWRAAGRLKMALGLLPQIGNRKVKTPRVQGSSQIDHIIAIVDMRRVTPQNRPSDLASCAQRLGEHCCLVEICRLRRSYRRVCWVCSGRAGPRGQFVRGRIRPLRQLESIEDYPDVIDARVTATPRASAPDHRSGGPDRVRHRLAGRPEPHRHRRQGVRA